MDLSTRKIAFIQEFLKLESENAISHLEQLLRKETKTDMVSEPMSIEQYQVRINQSVDDANNGRLTEGRQLISEIDGWI